MRVSKHPGVLFTLPLFRLMEESVITATIIVSRLLEVLPFPLRQGESHAIYNHTTQEARFLNFNVATVGQSVDSRDFGDDCVEASMESTDRLPIGRLDQINMAMAQVTDNPAMADGSSIHQDAKQQLHQYLRTYIQPLMRAGKPLDLKDILHHVNIRKSKLVQQLGTQQVQNILQQVLQFNA